LHAANAFAFAPAAAAIDSSQSRNLSNAGSDGESFEIGNFTEDFETNGMMVPCRPGSVNGSWLVRQSPSSRRALRGP
jgi:hypothetical protein